MNLEDHDSDDGEKVWLSQDEVETLIDHADGTDKRIAFALGERCGLRSSEIVDVAPQDVADTDAGPMLRVWHGKGDKFRETPIPAALMQTIQAVGDVRDAPADEPVLSVSSARSIRGWVSNAGDEFAEETGDPGWEFLSTHDLRRTWATALADTEVPALHVIDWGGWDDLETFREHYKRGVLSGGKEESSKRGFLIVIKPMDRYSRLIRIVSLWSRPSV